MVEVLHREGPPHLPDSDPHRHKHIGAVSELRTFASAAGASNGPREQRT